jgi:hypothetical protein
MPRKRKPDPTPAEEDGDLESPLSPEEVEALNGQPVPPQDEDEDDDSRSIPQGEDARLRRAADGQRRTRAADSDQREDAGLALSKEEQRRIFRDEFTQEALPKPPPIPGFHCCWLSATNQWDPIPRRVRMGYTPVTPDEVPDFAYLTQKSGQWEGMIGINEMLLYKIPTDTWKVMMHEFHHDQPLEEERGIKNRTLAIGEELHDSDGKALVQMEGDMEHLGRQPRRKPGFRD